MINKLKIFAIAMLATGATVANVKAVTNVLQSVSVALTVYEQNGPGLIKSGVSFTTKNMLAAVTNGLGTNGVFDKKATLDLLTTSTEVQIGTISVTNTNAIVTLTNTLSLSSNVVTISAVTNSVGNSGITNGTAAVTNLIIGVTNGGDYVIISATNTNVSVVTVGGLGPTTNFYATNSVTVDANQTAVIGTNAPVPVETNTVVGTVTVPIDTNTVTIVTNGVSTNSYLIGTNTVTFTTNTVTIGTNTYSYATNTVVTIGTNTIGGTNDIGFGTTNTFSSSLTSTFTLTSTTNFTTNVISATSGVTNTIITTNVTVVTTTTDLSTNIGTVVTNTPIFTNIEASELVVADGTNNTVVPTNIVYISELGTNDIVANSPRTGLETSDYSVKRLLLVSTGLFTNTTDNVTLKLQGLVHQVVQVVVVDKTNKPSVTNENWTDVSGYGTNNGTPIVVGGTITIGSPTLQKIK
jgi:hypothetical protein